MARHRPGRRWIWLRRDDLTNSLQGAVSIGIALLVACATLLASEAGGAWQQSVRADVRWSAAMIETVSQAYSSEAPPGFELAALEVRAERLAAAGRSAGTNGATALIEARSLQRAVANLRFAQKDNLIAGDKYRQADGSFDVVRRLNDLQAAEAGVFADRAQPLMEKGDSYQRLANVCRPGDAHSCRCVLCRSCSRRRPQTSRCAKDGTGCQPGSASLD